MSNNKNGVHSVWGTLGARNGCMTEREKNDYYATDPVAAEWLCKLENLNHNIWECACGEGNLSKVLVQQGFNVKSTDLIDRGYGESDIDFLEQNDMFDGDIVTNPPFKHANKFVEKALSLVPDGHKVCMFLKVQYLEGKSRRLIYDKYPPVRVWVSSSRLNCAKDGNFDIASSMIAYAWFVWEKGYKGPTELKWFN